MNTLFFGFQEETGSGRNNRIGWQRQVVSTLGPKSDQVQIRSEVLVGVDILTIYLSR